MDTGNAATEIVIPALIPPFSQTVEPSDATIILRITALSTNGWFDAIAPYHPTAVGVYSRLGRRPAQERATHRQRNVALLYASKQVLSSLLPKHIEAWRNMLSNVGLDPNDDSEDTTTAVGIGNVAGKAIVAARIHDGMNQLGDEGGRKYNLIPYADHTGYAPVNTAYEIIDAGRWQPSFRSSGNGIITIQQFATPQLGVTRPYSVPNPDRQHGSGAIRRSRKDFA